MSHIISSLFVALTRSTAHLMTLIVLECCYRICKEWWSESCRYLSILFV